MQMAVTLEQRRIRLLSSGHLQHHFFPDGTHYQPDPSLPPDSMPGLRQSLQHPDDGEAVLALAEVLAASKSTKLKMFAAALYQTVFRCASPSLQQTFSVAALMKA